ncbi:DUF1003 domain-containing protein [Paenibacillus athensensis]|uniref:DUF1003 domain-containing protein n=1 Tax=Paenibacillus athensensis TaxID=1967502 RepID=A0A4Y8PZG1_9BACL|nr:DUF1003 domain-containing protein [Paenibacillus athensensis]MCD1261200.1 DUF1003 domain-containing protein [Paenibacillus athensensis]
MEERKCESDPLLEELDREPSGGLNDEQLERVTTMVNEYQQSIKAHLTEQQKKTTSWSDRLADRIATFGGSWTFIVLFSGFLVVWMCLNTLASWLAFDKPPFILLNLILSCLSAFQAPIILMSQNRQTARDKQEAMLDFAINFRAEQENLELRLVLERIERRLMDLEGPVSTRRENG